eukprot:6338428-Prymnesium_polylepis.1
MLCIRTPRPSGRDGGYMGWPFTAVGGLRTLACDPIRENSNTTGKGLTSDRSFLDYSSMCSGVKEGGTSPHTHRDISSYIGSIWHRPNYMPPRSS